MAGIDVEQVRGGYLVRASELVYELTGLERDRRRGVRGNLALRKGAEVVFRTRLNLTAAGSRKTFLKACTERGVDADERVLLALDDVAHSPDEPTVAATKEVFGTMGDFSDEVPRLSLDELILAFKNWLEIKDGALVTVPAAVMLSHLLGLDLVWLLIVAPPSGAKTEVLRALYGFPGVFALSSLTARTFVSGLDTRGASTPSLIQRLDPNTMLVLKDLTSVLQLKHEEQQDVFGQLREFFDGRYDKSFGTGIDVHWEGRLGFLAGVTPIIDEHQQTRAILGERFLLLRVLEPPRLETAIKALEAAGQDEVMRSALRHAMHGFLLGRDLGTVPAIDQAGIRTLARTADFITRGRSGVIRDYRSRFEYAPEPEGPARLAKSLRALAQGIACARDHKAVERADLALVQRVALDCLPTIRHRVINALAQAALTTDSDGHLATGVIAGAVRFSTSTIHRALEDLHALEVVDVQKGGAGRADTWQLAEHWRDVFTAVREEAAAEAEPRANGQVPPTSSENSQRVPNSTFDTSNGQGAQAERDELYEHLMAQLEDLEEMAGLS